MENSHKKQIILSVEGNIGSGKSTLLMLMKSQLKNCTLILEPVGEWQKMGLLESFYQDPKRWGYSFQLFALFNRLKQWKEVTEIKDSDVLVSERSVLSDKHIFALNGKKYGLFSELEWALYNEHYEFLSKQMETNKIDGFVYLETKPDVCLQRLQKRNREEEQDTVDRDYLESLHQRHEEWLKDKENLKFPVLFIDGNSDFEQNSQKQKEIFNNLTEFIETIRKNQN